MNALAGGDDWLHRPTKSYYWGMTVQSDILAANYDGVIDIDRSSMLQCNYLAVPQRVFCIGTDGGLELAFLRPRPMKHVVTLMLIVVGIIHLIPLSGVLGPERLAALYGLSFTDPNLAILMRHRAVLFGLLGVFFVFAAFSPSLQTLAFVAGFASVVSFLCLAWAVGGYNAEVDRVFTADVVALACLVVGAAAHRYAHAKR